MKKRNCEVKIERDVDSKWSWLVCFSSFCAHFVAGGIPNSFGSFFVALLKEFKRSEAETAWIGSLAMGLSYLSGPLSTSLCHKFGCRLVACTGSLLLIISAFLTSIANNLMLMYLTFGVLGGVAMSMLYFSALIVLIDYFNKRLCLANGMVLAGSGVGTLCLNLLLGEMCTRYGSKAGFQTIAGVATVGFIAGLSYAPVKTKTGFESAEDDTMKRKNNCSSILKEAIKPGPHWQNKAFIVWTLALALIFFALFIPFVYLVRVAKMHGVPTSKGSLLVGFLAISQTIGKISYGRISDLPRVNRLVLIQLTLLMMSVATCLFPLARSYASLVVYAVVHGLLDGGFVVLLALVTHDIVGKRQMAGALGSMFGITAIPLMAGSPVAGFIYDVFGSYNVVYFLASGLICTGVCLMFLIPRFILTSSSINLEKQELILDQPDLEALPGMKEEELSNTFGKKTAGDLLLERNRSQLDNSLTISGARPSSFVLFSIVSDETYRDISTYGSRLDVRYGPNATPCGTPHLKKRALYSDIRHSKQSFTLPTDTGSSVCMDDAEKGNLINRDHVACTRETAMDIVREHYNEGPIKSQLITILGDRGECVTDSLIKGNLAKQGISVHACAQDLHSIFSSCSSSSTSLVSACSKETAGTSDSGFIECSAINGKEEGKFVINLEEAVELELAKPNSYNDMTLFKRDERPTRSEGLDFYSLVLDNKLAMLEGMLASVSSLSNMKSESSNEFNSCGLLETEDSETLV